MKIILSRKGFDSSSGGYCNPILPDGKTLLSLPIPGVSDYSVKYKDLVFPIRDNDGRETIMNYDQILSQLSKGKWKKNQECHLDPDIRENIILRDKEWLPAFGQAGTAMKFLDDMKVECGDIFLFFGRFRQTEFDKDGKLRYVKDAPEQHIIYGYMQIGEILHDEDINLRFPWHPHAHRNTENTLYVPTDKLSMNPNLAGCGVLEFDQKRVLTKYGMSISKWRLPDFFRGLDIRVNTKKAPLLENFSDAADGQEYFQFIGRGQEFVISVHEEDEFENFYHKSLVEWTYWMIIESQWDEVIDQLCKEKLDYQFGKITGIRKTLNGALVTDGLGNVRKEYLEQYTYCRFYHRIMEFNPKKCGSCPLLQGGANGMGADCEYDEPIYEKTGKSIPNEPRDRFTYYEILIQKGYLKRLDSNWDKVIR